MVLVTSIMAFSLLIIPIPIMISLGLLLLWAKFGHLENIKRKGIMIGTGVILFNMGILYALVSLSAALMTIGLRYYFYFILMSAVSDVSIIAIFILSYYFAGKYCGMHWPEPPRNWAKWLAIPWVSIIMISVMELILGFMGVMSFGGRAGSGIFWVFIAIPLAFIESLLAFSASYKGAKDGYKIALTIIADKVPPLEEKRELLDK